jgi:hypothetical protein
LECIFESIYCPIYGKGDGKIYLFINQELKWIDKTGVLKKNCIGCCSGPVRALFLLLKKTRTPDKALLPLSLTD